MSEHKIADILKTIEHGHECYRNGDAHYACALKEIARLQHMLASSDEEKFCLRIDAVNYKAQIALHDETLAVKKAEIERLRTQRDVALDDRDNYLGLSDTQRAEIEQLRELLRIGPSHG